MAVYFTWIFKAFKEDLAPWVALVYDTRSNNSKYNNAQFMYSIYKLYLSLHAIIHGQTICFYLYDLIRLVPPPYSQYSQVFYEIDLSKIMLSLVMLINLWLRLFTFNKV